MKSLIESILDNDFDTSADKYGEASIQRKGVIEYLIDFATKKLKAKSLGNKTSSYSRKLLALFVGTNKKFTKNSFMKMHDDLIHDLSEKYPLVIQSDINQSYTSFSHDAMAFIIYGTGYKNESLCEICWDKYPEQHRITILINEI